MTRFWTLTLPLLVLAVQIVFELSLSPEVKAGLLSENGPLELLQWLAIGGALGVAVFMLFRINPRQQKWIFGWVFLAAFCCLYVFGEEVSWGQHFLNWSTPEYWSALNDQNETNFHNTSSWLDQKPRLILLIGIIVGGIIFPLLQKYKPGLLPPRLAVIYPDMQTFAVAILVLGPYLFDKIVPDVFERVSEVQELYMFYFVLLYLVILKRRLWINK